MRNHHVRAARRIAAGLSAIVALAAIQSCEENLPSGPETFPATIRIRATGDTLVVGETRALEAEAKDAAGNVVQGLSFDWAVSDTNILGFVTPASPNDDVTAGRSRTLVGRRTGRSTVSLSLPDPRFVVTNATRNATVVVGGVRVLSSRDSTLTSINDTAVAIAAGLGLVNGSLVARPSQGIRWIHLGVRTTVSGQGDTLRYIARSNGVDTLIATHDFCLAGAKCADTIIARVSQQLLLTVTPKVFNVWSFLDTLGPAVTLADRRGSGLAGTTVRLVPVTAADSAIVRVIPPAGISNPTTGVMAAPRLVSQGNGLARVRVLGIAPDGNTVIATDSITERVRQVARRIAVEPLRAVLTETDSIPINPVARDARGALIADATVTIASSDIPIHDIWAGPITSDITVTTLMTISPAISGIARPDANPGAPQVPVTELQSLLSVVPLDTVKSGATNTPVTVGVLDSTGSPAVGETISFIVSTGIAPASVQVGANGLATVNWVPYDSAGHYTLTGVRPAPPGTAFDAPGRVVIRRSVDVAPGDPSPAKSTVAINATTIAANGTATVTVTLRDAFGNLVKAGTPSLFTASAAAGRGTIGAFTCTEGVCTATYTAPATTGADAITVKIAATGADILNSPIAIVIN
jgi:hypothetical protein